MSLKFNLNKLTCWQLVNIAQKTYSEMSEDSKNYGVMLDHFQEDIDKLKKSINLLFVDENDPLGQWELKRISAFDTLVDRIADILSITITDDGYILDELGLTRENAVYEIPEYAAVDKMLCDNSRHPGTGVHYSRLDTNGHYWYFDHCEEFINKQHNQAVQEYAKKAGLSNEVQDLVYADNAIKAAIEKKEDPHIQKKLLEHRKIRHDITKDLSFFKRRFNQKSSMRKKRIIEAHKYFADRLQVQDEQRDMTTFSLNDVSCKTIISFSENVFANLDKVKINDTVKKEFQKDYSAFRDYIEPILENEFFDEFDQCETEYSRVMEELVLKVRSHLGCHGIDSPKIAKEHENSDEYKATVQLLDSVKTNAFDSLTLYYKGDTLSAQICQKILDIWKDPENQEFLETINCLSLFNHCILLESQAEEAFSKIQLMVSHCELWELRQLRSRVCYFIGFVGNRVS